MMKFKIKKKDKVVVISGKDKGKTGEVLEIIPGNDFKPTRVHIKVLPNGDKVRVAKSGETIA